MKRFACLALSSALVLTACGSGADVDPRPSSGPGKRAASTSSTPSQSAATTKKRDTVVKSATSQFGSVLFDAGGQAIYLFDKEKSRKPDCYGACAQAWPPVLTEGFPGAAGDVQSDLLGVTDRNDGTRQVTYAGHPLYFYAHEGKNEVRCHNITGFGGRWLAVTPAGEAAPA